MASEDIELGIRNVIANQALEGLTLTESTIELVRSVAYGSLDVEEAIATILAEYPDDSNDVKAAKG